MLKTNFYGAPFEMEEIREPDFPQRSFRAEDYRLPDTGMSEDIHAIQRAVDDCSTQGGGTVIVSPGSGPQALSI